jgi:hypothetical protein
MPPPTTRDWMGRISAQARAHYDGTLTSKSARACIADVVGIESRHKALRDTLHMLLLHSNDPAVTEFFAREDGQITTKEARP